MIELAVLVLCSRANAASNCHSFRKEKTVEKTERLMWQYTDNEAMLVSTVGSCPSTIFTRLGVLTKVLGRIIAKRVLKKERETMERLCCRAVESTVGKKHKCVNLKVWQMGDGN